MEERRLDVGEQHPREENHLFSRELCWHRPVVAAATKVLSSAKAEVVEATIVELTKALSAIVVESQRERALVELLTTLRQRAERRR